ncbi:MAG: multicopper oxidase family protein [Planctomycetes bacterium]|nr:multicopper oxidase family protein [Planctomycetota bacterium]
MTPTPARSPSVCRAIARALPAVLAAVPLGAQSAAAIVAFTQPPLAADHSPDPRVFETVLTATEVDIEFVPGVRTRAMAFNGTIPGPTIDAQVGDTLIVHFVNMLPEATTLHWHGVATPATMDGSQLSQVPVPRSGYHRYEFTLNSAGTFWYHPHLNTNEQVERGLYGALIVRDPRHDAALGIERADERVLFLDDVKLDDTLDGRGRIAPFATDLGAPFEPWQRAEDLANSRIGNHVLLNGREVSLASVPALDVVAGRPYRLRLVNASNGRIFRLDLGDGDARLYAIGSDQGLWNAAEPVVQIDKVRNVLGHHNELISNPDVRKGVTLTPGDRLELVLVADGAAGSSVILRSHDFIKGKHTAYRDPEGNLLFGHDHFDGAEPEVPMVAVTITAATPTPAAAPAAARYEPPAVLRADPVAPLVPDPALPPLPVILGHSQPNPADGSLMFFLQVDRGADLLDAVHAHRTAFPADYEPRPMMKQRADDGFAVRVGETRVFEVVNFTGNDHNFHVHGFRFQHLDTEYVDLDEPANEGCEAPLRLAFEDTIRIPRRPGFSLGRSYTIVRLAARFDDDDLPAELRRTRQELVAGGLAPGPTTSGGWVLHCHFLEHSARGMMSFLSVGR